jgi:hypothetical protein
MYTKIMRVVVSKRRKNRHIDVHCEKELQTIILAEYPDTKKLINHLQRIPLNNGSLFGDLLGLLLSRNNFSNINFREMAGVNVHAVIPFKNENSVKRSKVLIDKKLLFPLNLPDGQYNLRNVDLILGKQIEIKATPWTQWERTL